MLRKALASQFTLFSPVNLQRSYLHSCSPSYQFVGPLPPVLLGPGMHLAGSPVVGARSKEFSRLSHQVMQYPVLKELGYKIYDTKYRWIIPVSLRKKAYSYSRDIFLDYIKKYQKAGITEHNIVRWVADDQGRKNYCVVENTPTVKYLDVSVGTDDGERNTEKGFYFPPHIVAYHEVMHAEEHKKNFYHYRYGRETITTIKTIILLDEVHKKIKNINLEEEIDYRKTIRLSSRDIPLGCFANFYRALEAKHPSLGDAIVSEESLEFLSAPRLGVVK
jgi:hypothetical protein